MADDVHELTGEQLRSLASEPRRRLVEALAAAGPLSVRELSELTSQKPTALYRHLRALTDTGLVVEVGARPSRRRPEALYGLVAPKLSSAGARGSPEGRAAFAAAARRYAQGTARAIAAALDQSGPEASPYTQVGAAHVLVRLDAERLAGLEALVTDFLSAVTALSSGDAEAPGDIFEITLLFGPKGRGKPPKADD